MSSITPRTLVELRGSSYVWRVVRYYPVSDSYLISRGMGFDYTSRIVNSSVIKPWHTR